MWTAHHSSQARKPAALDADLGRATAAARPIVASDALVAVAERRRAARPRRPSRAMMPRGVRAALHRALRDARHLRAVRRHRVREVADHEHLGVAGDRRDRGSTSTRPGAIERHAERARRAATPCTPAAHSTVRAPIARASPSPARPSTPCSSIARDQRADAHLDGAPLELPLRRRRQLRAGTAGSTRSRPRAGAP